MVEDHYPEGGIKGKEDQTWRSVIFLDALCSALSTHTGIAIHGVAID